MKAAVGIAVGCCLAISPLLLAGAAATFTGLQETGACSSGGEVSLDVDGVAERVRASLDGRGLDPAVTELPDPATQIGNAAIIQLTGVELGVPPRGQVIAIATALQESSLVNLGSGDRDSIGLFQQRPSQGWGTPDEIQDPVYASLQFYGALLEVPGWEELPLTAAAQEVQRSAYPDAYARWEPLAAALQRELAGVEVATGGECPPGGEFGAVPAGTVPDGYEIPDGVPGSVHSAISWALAQLGSPYQWGGTCTDPHGEDPARRCDCSSLMQSAYSAAGVSISRTTYTQVTDGSAAQGEPRPGDLLFTRPGARGPEHVGMFIGHGLVIHAPGTGQVVRIDSYADWSLDVIAVRRISG